MKPAACDDLVVGLTVVIVDDHAGFRSSARALLEAEGFDVVGEAGDGASGLAAVGLLRPRVVLLDIQLPDIDGFEVAERLAGAGDPPVVVLVSTGPPGTTGQAAGARPCRVDLGSGLAGASSDTTTYVSTRQRAAPRRRLSATREGTAPMQPAPSNGYDSAPDVISAQEAPVPDSSWAAIMADANVPEPVDLGYTAHVTYQRG